MAERSTVSQVVQLGVETTPGTAVAANRRLPGLTVETSIDGSFTEIMASGYKFKTGQAPGKEWTGAKLGGQPSYDEIIYPLMSVGAFAAPVQQAATTAYKWTHAPSSTAEDAVKSFTVEQGSAFRAHKAAYALVTEFGLKGDRDKVEQSGSMMMQQLQDGITLTAAPTEIQQVPILPGHVDVYMDTTVAGLGTTKLLRAFTWEWKLGSRFAPVWSVNSAVSSWAAHVEDQVDATVDLLVEADAAGMALWAALKAGTPQFCRIKATSPVLAGTAIPYSATFDFAVAMRETSKQFKDQQGVYALGLSLGVVHDTGWGKALQFEIINKRTAT